MSGCGHSKYAKFCCEDHALASHELEHGDDPQRYWGECGICAERIEYDIEIGKRTKNGDLLNEDEASLDKAIEADAKTEK